jgi:hypothetical protein
MHWEESKETTNIRHLSQIHLVDYVAVTQSILVPVPIAIVCSTTRTEPLVVAGVRHFHVHAYPPVERRRGRVHVQIGDAGLDDFLQDLACLLIGRNSDADGMPGIQRLPDGARKDIVLILGKVVEGIAFASMYVFECDTRRFGKICASFGFHKGAVKEIIELPMLFLIYG